MPNFSKSEEILNELFVIFPLIWVSHKSVESTWIYMFKILIINHYIANQHSILQCCTRSHISRSILQILSLIVFVESYCKFERFLLSALRGSRKSSQPCNVLYIRIGKNQMETNQVSTGMWNNFEAMRFAEYQWLIWFVDPWIVKMNVNFSSVNLISIFHFFRVELW